MPGEGMTEDRSTGRRDGEANSAPPWSLPERTKVLRKGTARIFLLSTVKGLLSEADLVEEAFEEYRPEGVGLHIAPEELKGLAAVVKGKVKETSLSSYEKVYARNLGRFGEVQIPPPSLVRAYTLSKRDGVPMVSLDLDEASYSSAYTKLVGGFTMVRQSLRLKRVNRKKFKAGTPADFAMEWDRAANKMRGYKKLESFRERHMADRIEGMTKRYKRCLCIVEAERGAGIFEAMLSKGFREDVDKREVKDAGERDR